MMKSLKYAAIFLISISFTLIHSAYGQNSNPSPDTKYQYPKPGEGVVRILTYNVRNALGMDQQTDYDRVASVIRAINPGVVALQELDSATTRSNGIDVLKVLAEKCGMKYIYGPSISYRGGKYGIGIMSVETPLITSFFSLPGREERRGLLMAEFKNYIFFCTHFSLTEADRVTSVELINEKAKELHKKVFLAGDLNASPESEAINALNKYWINLSGKQPTFPSTKPNHCIDYVWGINCCDFSYNTMKQEVVPEEIASDHRPVFVDISLNK